MKIHLKGVELNQESKTVKFERIHMSKYGLIK